MGAREQELRAVEALEALGAGALRESPARSWELFDCAWPVIEARVGVFLRSLRLSQEFREDCGQNALLRVWRSRESYRGHSADEFWAWAYRICRHEAFRMAERRGREAVREGDAAEDAKLEDWAADLARDETAEDSEAADEARALEECLAGLDERGRSVVELLYGPDASTERAVAMMLELSKSYVNVLRQKALQALEACLRAKGVEG